MAKRSQRVEDRDTAKMLVWNTTRAIGRQTVNQLAQLLSWTKEETQTLCSEMWKEGLLDLTTGRSYGRFIKYYFAQALPSDTPHLDSKEAPEMSHIDLVLECFKLGASFMKADFTIGNQTESSANIQFEDGTIVTLTASSYGEPYHKETL